MKYPKEQFEELVKGFKILSKYIDLDSIHPVNLHYKVFQQYSEGQKHNHLYVNEGIIKHAYKLELEEDFTGWEKLIDSDFDFKLYPEGCNDSHVETASKKAIKIVLDENNS